MSKKIEVNGRSYDRLTIQTHVITAKDNISEVAEKYAGESLSKDDLLFVSEKAVACSQNRAIPVEKIQPRKLALFLSKFVSKSPSGEGLGNPQAMEMAMREVGAPRILFAAGVGAIGRLFGKRGWFHVIAGSKCSSIDPPEIDILPEYCNHVILGPLNPDLVALEISKRVGVPVCVVDVNDLGANILGVSDNALDKNLVSQILRDNPLGQTRQQTPMGIIKDFGITV